MSNTTTTDFSIVEILKDKEKKGGKKKELSEGNLKMKYFTVKSMIEHGIIPDETEVVLVIKNVGWKGTIYKYGFRESTLNGLRTYYFKTASEWLRFRSFPSNEYDRMSGWRCIRVPSMGNKTLKELKGEYLLKSKSNTKTHRKKRSRGMVITEVNIDEKDEETEDENELSNNNNKRKKQKKSTEHNKVIAQEPKTPDVIDAELLDVNAIISNENSADVNASSISNSISISTSDSTSNSTSAPIYNQTPVEPTPVTALISDIKVDANSSSVNANAHVVTPTDSGISMTAGVSSPIKHTAVPRVNVDRQPSDNFQMFTASLPLRGEKKTYYVNGNVDMNRHAKAAGYSVSPITSIQWSRVMGFPLPSYTKNNVVKGTSNGWKVYRDLESTIDNYNNNKQ